MKKLAILIPAHNEEKVIGKTIESLLSVVNPDDIYVVNDGSTDRTREVAQEIVPHVLTLFTGHGKATATNLAVLEFNLINQYEYIMPIDADTTITKDFIKYALPVLEGDSKKEYICVVGKVTGISHNWVTAYRMWEYEIAQTIHKSAQAAEGAVIICPGCSTIYRSSLFRSISVPTGTLTEDMDLTFLIHRKKLGKIAYVGESHVVTQDPATLRDITKQLVRWYTGFWQCLIKHNIPWGGQMLDLEVGLLAVEGLFNGILMISLVVLIPIALLNKPNLLFIPFIIDFGLFLIPTMLYTGIKNKIVKILLYIPHFYLMRFLSSFIFFYSFIKVLLSYDIRMQWYKVVRY